MEAVIKRQDSLIHSNYYRPDNDSGLSGGNSKKASLDRGNPGIANVLPVLFCKIFLCHFYYNAGQQEYGNQVGNDHESVEGLGDAPHET